MKSGDLSDRDRAILAHMGRHRIAFQEVLRVLFFRNADPQKALNRLRAEEFIAVAKGFGGNRSCYYLLRKGAAAMGLSRRRSDAPGSEAFATYLAIYSFCFLRGRPRIRLEPHELEELFDGAQPPGRHHCLERSKDRKQIYHVYVPGETTTPLDVVGHVRTHIESVVQVPQLQRWIHHKLYTEAVLVHAPDRKVEIARALKAASEAAGPIHRKPVFVHVECVPGLADLEEGLRVLAEKAKANRPGADGGLLEPSADHRLQQHVQIRSDVTGAAQSVDGPTDP